MYVAPRPKFEDDPYYAVRLALAVVIVCIVTFFSPPEMPMMVPSITVGMMASIRRGFDIKKALGGPIALSVCIQLYNLLIQLLHHTPLLIIVLFFLTAWLAYYMILATGNPFGLLLLMSVSLMSIMGFSSISYMDNMADSFSVACLYSALVIPLCYGLIPPKNNQPIVDEYVPDQYGNHGKRAMIRTFTLFCFMAWLYTILDYNNIMLGMAAIFILVFPTSDKQKNEANERIISTILGGAFALVILSIVNLTGHFIIMLMCLALGVIVLGNKMVFGKYPPMVYQYAISTMCVLVLSGFSKEPISYTALRTALTVSGTLGAFYLNSLLESLFLPKITQPSLQKQT